MPKDTPTSPSGSPDAATPCDSTTATCPLQDELKLVELVEVVTHKGTKTNRPSGARKQVVNLAQASDPDIARPEYGRVAVFKGRVEWVSGDKSKALSGQTVHWYLVPDGGNKAGLKSALRAGLGSADGGLKTSTSCDASGWTAEVAVHVSMYGGDKFKVAASLMDVPAASGPGAGAIESGQLTVWRRLDYNAVYTMDSETYVDAATAVAEIQPAFTPAFAEYTRAAVRKTAAALTCKYLGLYDASATGKQKPWPAEFSPAKLGVAPTAAELADYAGSHAVKKAAAKAAIEAKAQQWFNAITADISARSQAWFAAVGTLPGNALLAVQYYHPKLSGIAADGQTNFWPAGISINAANPGSGLNTPVDPDQLWRNVQGFNRGTTSVIFKNYGTAARLQIVCRHEIGHATQAAFGRDSFGTGDHSASGLMTPFGGAATFSAADLNLLRGWKA